ncbi:hypothetical protein Agabi119p4_11446 [Agaricus bisporus var. burnettii]|uniref:RNA polymerase II degradation factor 1 n=1 Tax=Agaricus bisporus var. burnettii TaxID=192524 RepID=A0A8H7BYP7_AGABI|nr:hypothetical protein Agabi119p4_11446 [Agaricus bisporus var. burnettii]
MADAKFSSQLRSLKETFPDWSTDDLHSLLLDVNGDANVAAGRISDGLAVQWGSVSRKKDKKTAAAQPSSKEFTPTRGESRGARGGRGGRGGGPGRGGATARGRGAHRGSAVNGHGGRTASPRPPADHATPAPGPSAHPDSTDTPKSDVVAQQNGIVQTPNAWVDSKPDESSTANRKTEAEANAANANLNVALPKQALKTPAPARGPTKLSWAQIASKPTHKPTPPQPQSSQQLSPAAAPATAHPPPQESEPEPQASGWEDPTTAPSWEPEPSQPPTAEIPVEEPQPEPPALETVTEKMEDPPKPPAPVLAPIPEAAPAKMDPSPQTAAPALSASTLTSSAAATPSPKLASRPAVASSRASARNRATDQPVVMPSSFGSGVEKVGMQFGSLSLNGESVFESTPVEPEAPAPAPAAPSATETAAATTSPSKPQYESPTPSAPPATAPAASTSLGSVFQHQQQQVQQNLPSQPQHPPSVGASALSHQTLTTSVSQPTQSTQQATHTSNATASPLQQFSHQQQATSQPPSLANLQQTQQQQSHHQLPQHQHLPQQVQQSHTHHQYSHHLPAQLESQQHLPSTAQQAPTATTHSSYFRQNDTANTMPYFHTPTPPAGQSQDSPYGAFGQLASQNQHQQGSHLAGFNSADYNYDSQRGFYESYPQQTGFGNRNALGHEDNIKGLPGSQQQPPANSMPPSANQVSQHSSQSTAQPQSAGGQGPQFPPPPVPYYYNPYPQNQYYGTPYSSGYVPQPYVKYPAMFQPGPPGSNSAPSPATKQPGANANVAVQPQSNPYSQSLYGQQGAYDDYQQHAHHSQHQHPHALGLGQTNVGVGATEYSKQLYGGAGQGFIGLGGQSGGAASGVAGAGPRNASSPETAYKYQKDGGIGVAGGRGASVQGGPGQAQPQGQSAGQGGQGGPQGQGYYGANRFSGGVGAGIGSGVAPQQNAHHQQGGPQGHLAYPQGGNDGNFYPYQRQQYWQ